MSHTSRGVSGNHWEMKCKLLGHTDTALADEADAGSGALKWPELPSWVANAVGLKEAHLAKYHHRSVAPQHCTTGTCLSLY